MEKRFTAYKHLVEIKSFKEKVEIICEYELPFLEDDILLLRNLKDQAEEIEAYLTATDDAVLTSNVSVIDRSIFYRVLNLYKFDTFTQLKLLDGLKSLRRISERRTQTPPQSIPSLLESQPTPDPTNVSSTPQQEIQNIKRLKETNGRQASTIDSIIAHSDTEKAKDIIKTVTQNKRGIEASVAIHALMGENFFKPSISRRRIIQAIREYVGYIGSETSITNPWNEREEEVKMERSKIQKMIDN